MPDSYGGILRGIDRYSGDGFRRKPDDTMAVQPLEPLFPIPEVTMKQPGWLYRQLKQAAEAGRRPFANGSLEPPAVPSQRRPRSGAVPAVFPRYSECSRVGRS